jgi:hypothetical protein
MANLLTGDYDAVVQASESTLNRLLASMHQNAWQDASRPSLPHTVGLRLGDDEAIDGVRGSAWAQIGAPFLQLINGSTRQFELIVQVRMRYRPDPGTTYIPTYSVGPLRATYEVVDIDPSCFGWGRVASQYLWIRLVEGSVVFNSDSNFAEGDPAGTAAIDVGAARQKVARQIASLLATTFAAKPQRMSSQFQQRLFKSIREDDGSVSETAPPFLPWVPEVPIGGNAVAVPIAVTGPPAPESIDSIQHSLLAGRDFAVAVSLDVVMAAVNSAVDNLRHFTSATTVTWTIGVEPFAYTDSTVYHGQVNQASAVWVPQDTSAQILIDASGHAHTESILPDFNFRISQPLRLQFDPISESLTLTAEATTVAVVGSVSLPGGVWEVIAQDVGTTVQQATNAAIADPGVQSALSSLSSGASEVAQQVKALDGQADAHFDQASFYLSGIVFRGTISVAPRQIWPVTLAHKVDDETFSALDSWFPGGTITALEWSWSFPSTGATGHTVFSDRFVLRDSEVGPVPGLDGEGRLCLRLWLSTIDPVTGETLEGPAREACGYYTFIIPWRVGSGRFFSRHYTDEDASVEAGLREVSGVQTDGRSSNTLVVFAGGGWSEDDERTLVSGVAGCTRRDAGLLVVIVVGDGELNASGAARARSIQAVGERLAVPLVVTEDVDGSWSRGLLHEADDDGPSWRLLSPDGGLLWKADERIGPSDLTGVLEVCLYPSPKPAAERVELDAQLQPAMLASLLAIGHGRQHTHPDPNCPPWPGLSHGDVRSMISAVSFVRAEAASSTVELERLRTTNAGRGRDGPGVLVVFDSATEEESRRLGESLGPGFMVMADPDGSVAAGTGVRQWPTTISIGDGEGTGV